MVGAASHGWRMRAAAQAVLFAQTEQTVGRALAGRDAQAFLQMTQDIVTTTESTAKIGAHVEWVARRRLAQKQGVESGHAKDMRKREVEGS